MFCIEWGSWKLFTTSKSFNDFKRVIQLKRFVPCVQLIQAVPRSFTVYICGLVPSFTELSRIWRLISVNFVLWNHHRFAPGGRDSHLDMDRGDRHTVSGFKKNYCSTSEGWKHFRPRPQYRSFVTLNGSFQNFSRVPPSFLYEGPPPGRFAAILISLATKTYMWQVKWVST